MTPFEYLTWMIAGRHKGIHVAESSKVKQIKADLPGLTDERDILQAVEAKWHAPDNMTREERVYRGWVNELAAIYRCWQAENPSQMWDAAAYAERMAALDRRDKALKEKERVA